MERPDVQGLDDGNFWMGCRTTRIADQADLEMIWLTEAPIMDRCIPLGYNASVYCVLQSSFEKSRTDSRNDTVIPLGLFHNISQAKAFISDHRAKESSDSLVRELTILDPHQSSLGGYMTYKKNTSNEEKVQEEKMQEEKMQEEKMQEEKMQEEKVQEEKVQEEEGQEEEDQREEGQGEEGQEEEGQEEKRQEEKVIWAEVRMFGDSCRKVS